jgi:ferredoxin
MACVSQCPVNALSAGDDSPQVRFVEARCVQCGLCASSCPESAISLSARFVTDANQRNLMRTLHEDEPFCCIRCQKPFATHSVIARITEKMKDHPMFSGDALDRLKMCEDCRVKDIYENKNAASPDVHPGGHA